jgi:hypothetical protein
MIPLVGPEFINFDFGAPYEFTWRKSRFWYYVDYGAGPIATASAVQAMLRPGE